MDHVRFGRSGLTVSRLCIGAGTFGNQCDEPTAHRILDTAAAAGITFIDTADAYPLGGTLDTVGRSEEIVGSWLKGRRSDFILATKCQAPMGLHSWDRGTSRKHVLDAIDASLRRLGVDYVDLYQVHNPDPNTSIDETLSALDAVVRSGKARYVGCSNYLAYQVARALGRSDVHGWERFVSVQFRYNLLFRQPERELLPLCAEEGLATMAYNPLAGGLLTGKHDSSAAPPPGRFSHPHYYERYWHEREFATVAALKKIAAEARVPLVTLSIAWTLANPGITCVILGASRADHLAASIAGLSLHIEPAVKQRLDEMTVDYRMGDASR